MRDQIKSAVLVVGHGSRRQEANDDVRAVALQIAERGGFDLVEVAFLELEPLNISAGFARLVERGASKITVHPYFLSPGRHTRGDIPVEVAEAASQHPGISYRITEPLSAHPLVIAASIDRIREAIERDGGKDGRDRSRKGFRNPGAARTETPVEMLRRGPSLTAVPGTVYLVGAGPGDSGLLTVKARDLLESSDVVVYDYLVNPELLCYAPAGAERLYVGKVGGGRQTPQEQINYFLIKHAQRAERVVRLKGGDPFLFGRGAEEAEALRAAGVPFEVVPGISSALAVPAYAGIPLTHRDLSSSVAVFTGSRASDRALSKLQVDHATADTLVILMGVSHLRKIAAELISTGRSADTPAAVVRWGTYEGQQTVTGTLGSIADAAESAGMRPPAVIVIGEVVALREKLNWFEHNFASCALETA